MENSVFPVQLTLNSIKQLEYVKEIKLPVLKITFSMMNQINVSVLKMLLMTTAIDVCLASFLTSGIKTIKVVLAVEKISFSILNPRNAFNALMIILTSIQRLLSVRKYRDHVLNPTFTIPSLTHALVQPYLHLMMVKHAKSAIFPIFGT